MISTYAGMENLLLTVSDYHEEARRRLTPAAYEYYASGARGEVTLAENEESFRRIFLVPRVLRDVSRVDSSVRVLGENFSCPIFVAATAMHKLACDDGEVATYRAANRAGVLYTMSSLSTSSLDEIASSGTSGKRWFQLYIAKDRNFTKDLIKRVESAGFEAIVVTVDTPILGGRERDVRNRFHLPAPLNLAVFGDRFQDSDLSGASRQMSGLQAFFLQNLDASITWKDIEWIKTQTRLPIILKGIMSPADVESAVLVGAAGIIVSNHGARQLDFAPSTISVLNSIVRASDGRVPIFLDGGIRRGSDVLKALALGATAVFVGRPILWGLAARGEKGVGEIISLLKSELEEAMTLCGARTIEEIDSNLIFNPSSSSNSKL